MAGERAALVMVRAALPMERAVLPMERVALPSKRVAFPMKRVALLRERVPFLNPGRCRLAGEYRAHGVDFEEKRTAYASGGRYRL